MGRRKTSIFLLTMMAYAYAFGQEQAIDSFRNVVEKLQNSSQKIQAVQKLLQISQNYQNTSLKDAIDYATLAKEISLNMNYDEGLGSSYRFLGNYYKKLGKYPESIDAYSDGLEVFTRTKDLVGQSIIFNNFGTIYSDQGQESKALDYYSQALKLGEQAKDKKRVVTTLSNIGNTYLNSAAANKKALGKALEYFSRALPIARELKDDQITGTVTVNIGEVYMNQNKNDSALYYFKQSMDAFANTGDVCYTLNDIGKLFEKEEQYDSALVYHQRALKIATDLSAQEDMASSLLGIAKIYF